MQPWGTIHLGLLLFCLTAGTVVSPAGAAAGKNQYSPHPQVVEPAEGISWPHGQALPIFAKPVAAIDTLDVQTLTKDEQITFSALQGQVNRSKPRIYLIDSRTDEGGETWAKTPTMALEPGRRFGRSDKYELVAKYAGEVTGLVLYNTTRSVHYRNLAATAAAVNHALPATAAVQQQLKDHGIDLEVIVDLTELTHSAPLDIYQYMYDTYWPQCVKRLIVSARPDERGGDYHHTRDIAAACGAAMIWLDNRIPAQRDMSRKFLADMKAGDAIALGWYTTERSGITTASEFGIGTLPADHYVSGSVYSGVHHQIQIPAVPKKPDLENRAYIAMFISDGDNIQYTQHAMRKIWDATASSRGKVALNWTIAPGLVDIGPGIMNYYYTHASPKDCFVTGPSGMGYAMPFNTLEEPGAPVGLYLADQDKMDGYTRLTETYLQRSGLRVITTWDNLTPMQREAYERNCRTLYGATVQNFKDVPSVRGSVEGRGVRFDKLVIPYVGTYEHISRSLNGLLRRWDGQSPLFLSYQMSIWDEMKPDRIVALYEEVSAKFPGKVEFVRADHYFNLYNEANGLPFNLAMSPTTIATAGASREQTEFLTDGTPTTLWTSSEPDTQWAQFDFGQTYSLSRYVIRHAGTGAYTKDHNTRDFTVQISTDGNVWETVDTIQGNTENVTDVDLEPVSARFVKIAITHPGTDSVARIADVEFFGKVVN